MSGVPGQSKDETELSTASIATNSDSGGSEHSMEASTGRVQLRRRDSDADIKDRISVVQKVSFLSVVTLGRLLSWKHVVSMPAKFTRSC